MHLGSSVISCCSKKDGFMAKEILSCLALVVYLNLVERNPRSLNIIWLNKANLHEPSNA